MKLIIKTFHGLEAILVKELELIDAKDITPLTRAVACSGNKELLYKANLHLRTALRVLQPIYTFNAINEEQLYKKIKEFNWQAYLNIDTTFAIDSIVFSEHFNHSKYVALKIKDAIVDQFRQKMDKRPSIDTDNPDVRINVYVSDTVFNISLDSSGNSLHKRGYRTTQHKAPLNEALAAGMLLLTGWDKDIPLTDPMCGGGTIVMEAAMIARNIPPGFHRKSYGFMKWNDYDAQLWDKIYKEAGSKIDKGKFSISGADISSRALDIARETALNFGMDKDIRFTKSSFKDYYPQSKTGILIMNPPYGERMQEADIFSLYKGIGDHLKKNFTGFDVWILSSNKEAMKHIGLRASKKYTLFNGPLECKFQKYSLYSGSLKKKQ